MKEIIKGNASYKDSCFIYSDYKCLIQYIFSYAGKF